MMDDEADGRSGDSTRLVNGVFAGGGAKALAYIGAFQALEDRGLWFGSVAGTSAGAITASLVASGMRSEDMQDAIPNVLRAMKSSVPKRLLKAAAGHAHSVFDSAGLRAWLDETLRERIGPGDGPVTFAELHQATGIGLYVVATDLVHGLPVVFSRHSTPHVDVAGAVVASSAIPGVFPAGRAVFDAADGGGVVVHQLVDGGAWANYPAFVFDDSSFRTWLRGEAERNDRWTDEAAWEAECDRQTFGMVLGDPDPLDQPGAIGMVPAAGSGVNRRFDRGPTYTSKKRISYLFGATFSSDWARLLIAIAIAVWVSLSLIVLPIAVRRFAAWLDGWVPDVLTPILFISLTALAALSVVTAIVALLGLVVIGRIIADTILPSLFAVLGVPMDVPPWLGLGEDALVVFVPRGDLKTTQFEIERTQQDTAVAAARASVNDQLDRIQDRLDALLDGREPPTPVYEPGTRPQDEIEDLPTGWPPAAIASVLVAAAASAVLAWLAVRTASTDGIWWVVVTVLAALGVGGVVMFTSAGHGATTAAGRSLTGVAERPAPDKRSSSTIALGVVLMIGGLIVSAVGDDTWDDDTIRGTVTTAEEISDDRNAYDIAADDEVISLEDDRHLRIGETVFVRDDGTTWELAGRADTWTFAVAVGLVGLGLVVVTAGVKRRNWSRHNTKLHELVTTWRARARPTV